MTLSNQLSLFCLGVLSLVLTTKPVSAQFLRGDVNCTGGVNFIDAVDLANHKFRGYILPCDCEAAQDMDFDNVVDLTDSIYLLNFLFSGGPPPVTPYPSCGAAPPGTTLSCVSYPACPLFKRGDVNQDGCVSLADSQFIADFLFNNGPPPACMNSADGNDDEIVDINDVTYVASYCNGSGSVPPAPGPFVCGNDPTPGALGCSSYSQTACNGGCVNQLPTDCNQDGLQDISDPVCLMGFLFAGTPVALPCGDGSAADPRNILLMDANGDFALDISDGVYLLDWLFIGGPGPAMGTSCTYIEGCVQHPGLPGLHAVNE